MDAYTSFAEVYDMFMDNIPYEDWCGYLTSLLKEYGIDDGLVLDLGCGTGTLTELLAKEGYDMIGVDVSEDMLQEAIEKRAESGLPILYLLQDMREFELYGTVRALRTEHPLPAPGHAGVRALRHGGRCGQHLRFHELYSGVRGPGPGV